MLLLRGDNMSLITCNDDCIYQKDGYCMLETPSVSNNHLNTECIYYTKLSTDKSNLKRPKNDEKIFSKLFFNL